ncbi:MAG: alpha/beta hydrolase [Acidimicrobiales bacterium]
MRPAQAIRPLLPRGTVDASIVVLTGALLVLVGYDGSPLWRLGRAAAVLLLAVLVARLAGFGDHRAVHPCWGAIVSFLAGSLGLATGLGIGVPHAAKTGLSLLSVVGIALVASGLVLGVHGARALLRPHGRWVRIPLATGLLVAAVVVVWSLGIAVAATNVPRTSVGSATPADDGLTYRDVTFTTGDGAELSGWYLPSGNGAAVVLLHGAGSTRSGVLDHAVVLARQGFGVLLFDARGHGRSGGRAMDFGWYGDADIAAATGFLAQQPDVLDGRIAAVGMSMGGEQALGALGSDPRLGAVVAEGATGRTAADKAWLPKVHGFQGTAQQVVDRLLYGAVDLLTTAGPPVALRDAVAAGQRPVLLIAAAAVPDEVDAAHHIREGAPGVVEVWVVPQGGHTGGLRAEVDEWTERVTGFLADALGVAAG